MGIEKFINGQVSPMDTGKKDVFGATAGEKDITEKKAEEATYKLLADRAKKVELDNKTLRGIRGGYEKNKGATFQKPETK